MRYALVSPRPIGGYQASQVPNHAETNSIDIGIESLAAASSSEIELLFHAVDASEERRVIQRARQTLKANLVREEFACSPAEPNQATLLAAEHA